MGRKRVVIVGGGFGGLHAAKGLHRSDVDVTVIDRANHHTFQPLLYQVASAGLTPAEVAVPIRSILSRQQNVEVLMAEVVGVDLATRSVQLRGAEPIPFDFLILATGVRHSYFGKDDWERWAPGLKTLDDAVAIRRKVLVAFENAESHEQGRDEWLTFVVIGGGPTGVELAGAIAELAKRTLRRDFDRIRPESANVILLEGGPRLLTAMPEPLSERAKRDLEAMGVEVRLNARVTGIDGSAVHVGEETIRSRCVLWAAGVKASSAGEWLGVSLDRAGRVPVGGTYEPEGLRDVFVIGDLALCDPPFPGIAPVAMQQGDYVAKVIAARVAGKPAPGPFRFRDKGQLATIGRSRAVGVIAGRQVAGFLAWFVWAFAHIINLIGFRNRVFVFIRWAWAYFTWQQGARLITGVEVDSERLS